MKIMFLIESLQLAGAERVVLELAQGARREGCEAHIVTLREENSLDGSPYQDAQRQPLFRRGEFNWPKSAPAAARRLRRALEHLRPDVVAVHSPKAAEVAALAGVHLPTLWVLHGHDVCWDGATARRRLSRALQRWTRQRLGGQVAAVSPSLADHAAEGLGMGREEIAVLPNGIELDRFRFAEKTPGVDVTVCMLGRLVPWKGPLKALEAFGLLREQFPKARLWLMGDGPMRGKLEAEVAARGWDGAVTFWGMLRQPETRLREATVLWMPSEREGFGLACVEAMASGLPVVGFDVRGVRDVLQGGCGVLVRPKDAKGLAEQTARLLRDAERYQKITRAARARVEDRYSLEKMWAGHYELMRRLGGGAQGQRATTDSELVPTGASGRQKATMDQVAD